MPSVEARFTGPSEIVFDWSEESCESEDIPDLPARAFRDSSGRVHLIASHFINREMVGRSLNRLSHRCDVVLSSDFDPRPGRFDDRQWISSLYTRDGETVFALLHHEYQGHTHPGRCPSGVYRNCWYNSIALAVSNDGGRSFSHAAPPAHLVATIPYRYVPDGGPLGLFSPSNIVYNREDGYYYSLVQLVGPGDQRGSCVMRSRDLADPKSWRAWDGRQFAVRFVDPYRIRVAEPEDHVCEPVAPNEIQEMVQSLTYNTYLEKYVLVGTAGTYDARTRKNVWGIYFSVSDDLIHWSRRKLIVEAELTWTFECGDANPIAYPSLLDPNSGSRSFETTGKRAYLYFTRFHYRSCDTTLNRDLVRVPLEFVE